MTFHDQFTVYQEEINTYLKTPFSNTVLTCVENYYDSIQKKQDLSLELFHVLSYGDQLQFMMAYTLLAGGKRIRPVLAMATADLLNQKPDEDLMKLCLALESAHTYSLIHDDLPCMDDDSLRRGRPTLHSLISEAAAVLAGDALLNKTFEILLSSKKLANGPAQLVGQALGGSGLILGQWMDLNETPQEDIQQMIAHKTGQLFKISILSVCSLYNVPDEDFAIFEDFADILGLAFQIKDDLLDISSSVEVLGKSVGKDTQTDKHTFVYYNGVEASALALEQYTARSLDCLAKLKDRGYRVEFLVDLMEWLKNRKQ